MEILGCKDGIYSFNADLHLAGEQMEDRGFLGDTITTKIIGQAGEQDGEIVILEYEIQEARNDFLHEEVEIPDA